ncbi:MAG: prepilin-type N-terminal cleavage/methylation domain-containing protein [Desulfobacteraceae bacterium]|jgi:prepilin-type N-terminal cleavage/methylation domain-containing protein|nr:prepilin-type N-terminal cleavage/methylation domain-containing protein [Desulfobacteraceae bacterium]
MITQQGLRDLNKNLNDRGLSIIEVIFALSIFAIGILAVSTLALSAISSNASARRVTDATTLAEDRLERLAAMAYEDITGDSEMVGPYQVTWVVVEDDIVVKTKSITVTVNCPEGWKNTNVVIRHLISKNS